MATGRRWRDTEWDWSGERSYDRRPAILNFADLLRVADIDPDHVRLVRHHDSRNRTPTVYAVWRAPDGRERVEAYQRVQKRKPFKVGDLLASFVVTPRPRTETVFIGMYRVDGLRDAPTGMKDPIYGGSVGGFNLYDISREPALSEYADRLAIDWGEGTRAWVQRASGTPKPVVAIREPADPPFPGFTQFSCDVDDVPGLYETWQEILRNVKGIYVLVDKDSGAQYVGSAKGEESLLGRFMEYAETGHGGNVELRARGRRRYQVSVLEVVDTRLPDQRIEEIEASWKTKLLSREFGLNKN